MAEQSHTEGGAPKKKSNRKLIALVVAILVIVGVGGGGIYFYVASKTIYIDDSTITAPLINLSPVNSGILQAVYVNPGDEVT
jgi:multidrug resistance efflux pump